MFITTRHDSNAELTFQALRASKHVWVEKTLALALNELRDVAGAQAELLEVRQLAKQVKCHPQNQEAPDTLSQRDQ